MSVFDVSFTSLIWVNIASGFRKVVNYAWVKCLCVPVIYLQGLFNATRAANLYYVGHNSQVCRMQGVLNDAFDNTSRRITIIDPVYNDPLIVYLVSETVPSGVDALLPVYEVSESMALLPLYTEAEVGIDNDCFIVWVPTALGLTTDQVNQLTGLVNQYRLPSRNVWGIVYY